jgi:hypothetical protein
MLEPRTLVVVAPRDVLVKPPIDYKSAMTPEHRPVTHCVLQMPRTITREESETKRQA